MAGASHPERASRSGWASVLHAAGLGSGTAAGPPLPLSPSRPIAAMLFAAIGLLAAPGIVAAQQDDPANGHDQKRVLVVHSSRRDAPYTVLVENALRGTLGDGLAGRFDYYVEYIDAARFTGPAYAATVRDFLRNKYRDLRLDVIIGDGETPFDFLVQHRAELFPGVPLIFSKEGAPVQPIPNATGVTFPVDMRSTLDLALGLQPTTKSV